MQFGPRRDGEAPQQPAQPAAPAKAAAPAKEAAAPEYPEATINPDDIPF